MKILLVSPLPPPTGGMATWTLKYRNYCERKGISLSIVNTALNGIRSFHVNSKRNLFDEIKRTSRIIGSLRKQLKAFNPDIVHINTSCSKFGIFRDYICAHIVSKKRHNYVLHCHCNIEDQISSKMAASLFRNIIQNAKTVLTLNSKSFEYVNNITCKGVYIVPNFVDELLLHREYRVRKEIKEIVFVGYVRKSKGCIEIIAVAKQFPQLHFTLVGPVSEEIAVIEMPDNISLVGKNGAEEVMEYLHNADVFLLPSYTEGFSLSLTEAMSIGLPAIATDVGANADMLENKGGLIIKPKSVQAISDALRKLEKYSVRQNMSEWNVSKVYNSYTTDKVMEKIMSIYLGVNRTQN